MATIALEHVTKRFDGGAVAVRGLDLEVGDGELLVLVGPSGCGKSTTLRMIAGLEQPTEGVIRIGGDDVTDRPARDRDVAMVFQSYALYPHKTVRANLAFPLRMRRFGGDIGRRVRETAELLGIADLLDRRPAQLSGGQRQRVALGRAMVREPKAFLFDEPLSNLDPALRLRMRAELLRLHRRLGSTVVHVTHDQEEALTLGRRMAVMHEGAIEQLAAPDVVYRRPSTVFVAGFVGAPPMNLMPAERTDSRLRCGALDLPLPPSAQAAAPSGGQLTLGIRPQDLKVVPTEGADLAGEVELVEPLGHDAVVHLRTDPPLRCLVSGAALPSAGELLGLQVSVESLHLFGADGRRLTEPEHA